MVGKVTQEKFEYSEGLIWKREPDIENKMKAPITDSIADFLILLANDPARYKKMTAQAARTQSFIKYALG